MDRLRLRSDSGGGSTPPHLTATISFEYIFRLLIHMVVGQICRVNDGTPISRRFFPAKSLLISTPSSQWRASDEQGDCRRAGQTLPPHR